MHPVLLLRFDERPNLITYSNQAEVVLLLAPLWTRASFPRFASASLTHNNHHLLITLFKLQERRRHETTLQSSVDALIDSSPPGGRLYTWPGNVKRSWHDSMCCSVSVFMSHVFLGGSATAILKDTCCSCSGCCSMNREHPICNHPLTQEGQHIASPFVKAAFTFPKSPW